MTHRQSQSLKIRACDSAIGGDSVVVGLRFVCSNLKIEDLRDKLIIPQELEVRSLNHPYSLKTKSSQCHYVVMIRSETKLSVAIPAPVSGQSAVNVATATSKCSKTFLLPYDQDGDVKTKQDNVSNILLSRYSTGKPIC